MTCINMIRTRISNYDTFFLKNEDSHVFRLSYFCLFISVLQSHTAYIKLVNIIYRMNYVQ